MNRPVILLVGNFLSARTGSRSAGEELNVHLKQNGWRTIATSVKKTRLARLFDMLFCIFFRRNEYQIAYLEIYSGLAFVWAEIVVSLLHFLKKPCVLGLHGGRLMEFAQENKSRIENLFAKTEYVTTPSHFLRDYFCNIYPNIIYMPNGIDAKNYTFRKRMAPAPKLIWVRAFHSVYQPLIAIRVLEGVKKVFPQTYLTMIGGDKKDGSLQETIKVAQTANLTDSLSIVGSVSKKDIPVWLDKADIFLNTTRYESFGVSVLEAACAGLPIVTTNVGELPHLWKDQTEALLVSPDDSREMVQAVLRILNDSSLAETLSTKAHDKAIQFDWSTIMPQWEELFLKAAC